MIIGISGRAGVGKSTLAEVAVEKYNFVRVSFASLLKEELITWLHEREYDFNPEAFYGDDSEKQCMVILPETHELPSSIVTFNPIYHTHMVSYRQLMQWFGDKRKVDNPDYWLQRLMETVDFSVDIIIDDVRFVNEAALIQALGGIIVRINWPARLTNSTHLSETQMDNFPTFDSVITKDDNISLLEFHDVCIDHLNLWLGRMDETNRANHATSTFNLSSLRVTHDRLK